MTPDPRTSLARLLELKGGPDLLDRWAAEAGHDDAWPVFHAGVLAELRTEPARVLKIVERVRGATASVLDGEAKGRLERLLAHALKACGRMGEADEAYARSWGLLGRASPIERARTAIGWSDTLALVGRADEALKIAERGRRLLGRRDPVLRARLDGNLGTAYYLTGRLEQAATEYRGARRRFLRAQRPIDGAVCAWNLGNVHLLRGESGRARESYLRARAVFEAHQLTVPLLHCRYGLAALALGAGDWSEGLEELTAVREELLRAGDQRAAANVDEDTASLLASLGANGLAAESASRAHGAFRQLGLAHEQARCAALHARALAIEGRKHDAAVRLEQAVAYWRQIGNVPMRRRVELELARVEHARGQTTDALARITSIQRWADRSDPGGLGARARALRASIVLERGRPADAARLARRAHREARRHPARWERPFTSLLVARAEGRRGNSRDAVRWARKAVREYEQLAIRLGRGRLRAASSSSLESLVRGAVDVVLDHAGSRAARTAMELLTVARSPALLEDLLRGRRQPLEEELRTAITRLRDELLSAEEGGPTDVRTRSLRGEVEVLERRLERLHRSMPAIAREVLARRQVRAWIPRLEGRQLVFFDRSERGWRAFVVSADRSVDWVALPDAENAVRRAWLPLRMMLEAAAHAPAPARHRLLARTADEAEQCLHTLRTAFWKPLGELSDEVVITPVGPLNGIPLEAALECGDASPRSVTRVPHPALIPVVRPRRPLDALLLRGLVPGADAEIRTVQGRLEAAGYRARVESTREGFLRRDDPIGVLHVAAHGSYHRSRLVSTGIQLEDGWLGFEQLEPRQLRGALLFFDSCESGLAMEAPGSELDGWMSAGLAAGAQEFVLTLWKLDDEAAGAFANVFYREWCQRNDAATAAAIARRELRRLRPHPFAWAPFVTVG